jgi:hypothetical protein
MVTDFPKSALTAKLEILATELYTSAQLKAIFQLASL